MSDIHPGDHQTEPAPSQADEQMPSAREVFLYFLLLGFINVGGPGAQITMMYNKMVERGRWLSKDRLVVLLQYQREGPLIRQREDS